MSRHARPTRNPAATTTRPRSHGSRLAGAALTASCLLLGACAGGPATAEPRATATPETTGDDDVATLETEPAAPSSAPVDPLVERYGEQVRLRLDSTEEEEIAAWMQYDACVAGESGVGPATRAGAPGDGGLKPDVGPGEGGEEDRAKQDAAAEACMVVQPLPPWEYDVQNPDAVDFTQAIVDCLRAAGVQYVEVVQDAGQVTVAFGGEDNHGPSISLGLERYDQCEQEVAASGVGG